MQDMRIEHTWRTETNGNHDGRRIPVTVASYKDDDGKPMMASLHGHLHQQIVERSIKAFRADAASG